MHIKKTTGGHFASEKQPRLLTVQQRAEVAGQAGSRWGPLAVALHLRKGGRRLGFRVNTKRRHLQAFGGGLPPTTGDLGRGDHCPVKINDRQTVTGGLELGGNEVPCAAATL